MTIENPSRHELMPIPPGSQFLDMRALLAGGDLHSVSMDRIRTADRLLQTADCVGTLACCDTCDVPTAPCPVALDSRTKIIAKVFGQPQGTTGVPDERSVLVAAMDAWQQTYTVEQP